MANTPTNMDNVIDSLDVIARIEELEGERKPWVAGWNMPGYMPDNEPAPFADFNDARDYIVAEMRRAVDEDENASNLQLADAENAATRWEAIETAGEHSETVGEFHYWVTVNPQPFEDEGDAKEYASLKALAEEAEGSPDWPYGETLIRASYFKTYAQELAEDTAPFSRNCEVGRVLDSWPYRCIDWEQAARELMMDYSTVNFDGVEYLIRS